MILIGVSMRDRKYILGLFSIFFITTIFAEENRILWGFGLIIKPYVQQSLPKKKIKSLSNSVIEAPFQNKALIANPFVPPTLISFDNKVSTPPVFSEFLNKISFNNIQQITLLVGRLTMQSNYQPIIDIISQIDLRQLDENDYLDLNYWLANAFLHTGKYKEAEDVILTNLELKMEDRFHFLLAMTYESQGRIYDAQEEYLKFVKQYPKSDYKVTALIKARILGRH